MRRFAPVLLVAALLGAPRAAHADEFGYQLGAKVGLAGLATGAAVGPALAGTGLLVAWRGTRQLDETGQYNSGILAGAALVLVGGGLIAISPMVVVGSALGSSLALRDMKLDPSLIPLIVGAGGVGLQVMGWFTSFGSPAAGLVMRLTGWTTAMIGGGVQMSVNHRVWREYQARTPRRSKFRVTLVPTGNGVGVVGSF